MRRAIVAIAGFATAFLVGAAPAGAHPLGNFTTNVYAGLQVADNHVNVDYILDLAEIPAVAEIQRADTDHDGVLSQQETSSYATDTCNQLLSGLDLRMGGGSAPMTTRAARASTPAGQAGLNTVRVECNFQAKTDLARATSVRFKDDNFNGRVGWHELTAVGDGTTIVGGPRPTSLSHRLTAYPKGTAPLAERATTFQVRPGGPKLKDTARTKASGLILPRGMDRFTTAFTGLVARQHLDIAFGVLAVLIATVLGATHALAPGHGKTVIAAYLISQNGARRVALVLGVTVAVSHTAGVLLLGTIVSTSASVAPEHLYPYLGAFSGLTFAGLGVFLLARARRRGRATHDHHSLEHEHSHDHGLDHAHHDDHEHPYDHDHAAELPPAPTWRTAMLPGLAGGLVPSPSALLVYLGGLAIGRTWFAVLLVVGYGIGIAATLIAAGYLLGRARNRLANAPSRWRWAAPLQAALPTLTAALVILGGLQIAIRSLALA